MMMKDKYTIPETGWMTIDDILSKHNVTRDEIYSVYFPTGSLVEYTITDNKKEKDKKFVDLIGNSGITGSEGCGCCSVLWSESHFYLLRWHPFVSNYELPNIILKRGDEWIHIGVDGFEE